VKKGRATASSGTRTALEGGSFTVGDRFRVDVVIVIASDGTPIGLEMTWDPDVPAGGLSETELADYIAGRDRVLADLAEGKFNQRASNPSEGSGASPHKD